MVYVCISIIYFMLTNLTVPSIMVAWGTIQIETCLCEWLTIYAGVVTTLMSLCKTFEALLMFVVPFRNLYRWCANASFSARIFLGFVEAGLDPGVRVSHCVTLGLHWHAQIIFYLSLWYRRKDLALRVAIFVSAATAAGTSICPYMIISHQLPIS